MFGVCSGDYFLLSGAMLDAISTLGAKPMGFAPLQPLGVYLWQAYVQPGDGHQPTPGMHRVAAPSTTLSRGSLMLLLLLLPSHPIYMVGHTTLRAWQRHPIHSPALHSREQSSFPGLVPSDDTVNSESAMGIKPDDSGVVIGYHFDDFTHIWSVEQFVAHSHIYPGFTSKV